MSLEKLSWVAQITVAAIALFAAAFTYFQIRAYQKLEVLKYLESSEIRRSRRIVFREIRPRKDDDWWDHKHDGEHLEAAASDVCASYDILGRLIGFSNSKDPLRPFRGRVGYKKFFLRYWARSIVDNHDMLAKFLVYRRTRNREAYTAFTVLAETARRRGYAKLENIPLQEK